VDAPVPPEAIQGQQKASGDNAEGYLMCTLVLVMSPLVLEEPTQLRVRVDADGEELKGPALMIDKQPAQAAEAVA
jgi:hypothetical protein